MSLEASNKIATNPAMQARVTAAIRQTAPVKTGAAGAPGALAERVMSAPDAAAAVAAHFLLRVSTDADSAAKACPGCGYSAVTDEAILWIVDHYWDDVAAIMTPVPTA